MKCGHGPSESDRILQGLHAKSQLKPHEIIEAKAQVEKLAPETVDLSKKQGLEKKAKKARAPKVGDEICYQLWPTRNPGQATQRWPLGGTSGLIKMTLKKRIQPHQVQKRSGST